jgi:hypothetical protein
VEPALFLMTWNTIDDDLVATTSLLMAHSRIDNCVSYDLLKPLFIGGEAWPFVQPFDHMHDKRGAYFLVKTQAEGPAALATRKAEAYKNIKDAKFTGAIKNWNFDKYVHAHQTNHNKLALIGEPISETKKVADFLEQISAPSLTMVKENVLHDVAKLEDFHTCQQYLKQVLLSQKARNTAASTIVAVGTKSNTSRWWW